MLHRTELEEREKKYLAPYATISCESLGRDHVEPDHPYRTAFQRDKDRVLFSTAFRRLQYKTQVFPNVEGDHYRTRLTHTLEVAHIARSISRSLGLNEDLSEAIALAHDLGHGPFGHIGETILNDIMEGHGGFEHNRQSLRIVEQLEDTYPKHKGLNLTKETRDGLKKHTFIEEDEILKPVSWSSLEAQVVDRADEIAYSSHDLDDGLRSGLLKESDLDDLRFWQSIQEMADRECKHLNHYQRNHLVIRLLINEHVTDLIHWSDARIEELEIHSLSDVHTCDKRIIGFSDEVYHKRKALNAFLFSHFYQNPRVTKIIASASQCLHSLFSIYSEKPELLPRYFYQRMQEEDKQRVLCDYISGMTDRFAYEEFERIKP